MNPVQRTMPVIAAFLAAVTGTFIYFIANWGLSGAEPIGAASDSSSFSDLNKSRGSGGWPPVLSAQQEARS